MVAQKSDFNELKAIVGTEHIASGAEAGLFGVDESYPQVVVHPGTYEEVASVIRLANSTGLAVIPWGTGNQMHFGNVPAKYDIALSLSRLTQLIEHEPADLTVSCQAGMHTNELNRRVGESGQVVPFRISITPFGTVGGMLASGDHGNPRDFTIGMRVVTADGRITRAGGKVVKNVAGYDLCKLYIGSLGTLCVIVEATFKLRALPQTGEEVDVEFESLETACHFMFRLEQRGLAIQTAVLTKLEIIAGSDYVPIGGYRARVHFGGTLAAIDRSHREASQIAEEIGGLSFDTERLQGAPSDTPKWVLDGHPLACSVLVPPAHTAQMFSALEAEGQHPTILAWPLTGELEANWPGVDDHSTFVKRLKGIAARSGAILSIRQCSPDLKRRIDVFGDPPPAFELMRRVKQQFDPNGILSPGRFVGRL